MFGSSQKSVEQKPLEDANFLSVYVYVYVAGICRNPAFEEILELPRQLRKFVIF